MYVVFPTNKGGIPVKNHPSVLHSPLFAHMTAAQVESLLLCLQAKRGDYPKGAALLRVGEPVTHIGLLLEGGALVEQRDFWGNRNILSRIEPGQVFGAAFICAGKSVANVAVVAAQPCSVLWLDARCVTRPCGQDCANYSQLIRNLLFCLAQENRHMNEKLAHMTQRTTRQKLLAYLFSEAARQGKRQFSIPYDRQQLADYLSVERSAMSAALSRLRRDGLIAYQKNQFTLLTDPTRPDCI